MKIAACQPAYVHDDLEHALSIVLRLAASAEAEGARVICFPECFLQGYAFDQENLEGRALNLHSQGFERVLKASVHLQITVVVGLIESDSGRLYNTAVVIRDGLLLGQYRKMNLMPGETQFESGDEIPVFEVSGLRFGISICSDLNDSEGAQAVADQEATLLLCPCNNMMRIDVARQWRDKHNEVRASRAIETGMFIVSSDVVGEWRNRVSFGSAAAINPSGVVTERIGDMNDEILYSWV